MDIDGLLEELDNAEFDYHTEKTPSSSTQPISLPKKQGTEFNRGSNETAIENIDSLLEGLNSSMFDDNDDDFSSMSEKKVTARKNETTDELRNDEIDKEIETAKKESSSKYSVFGHDIHKKLKESQSTSNEFNGVQRSWKTRTAPEKTSQLAVSTTVVTGKLDVYAEPTFGLRLVNPVVSSQFIQSKMAGKQPVAVSNIPYHLRCGDKNTDWVFAGAVVFKSGLKTSQKGSQYCTWKISDLKGGLETVSVYLFSKACSELWKIAIGTVVAILNATPFNKDEQLSKNDLTLTVRNEDQVMIWGGSRDYGVCKAKKKNGDNCTSFVNKSACEFCLYHVKTEYNKFSRRSDLQFSSSGGMNSLRNKVLGKNEVFYGGKSFSALKPPPRDNKVRKRDNQLLNKLAVQAPKQSAFSSQFDKDRLEKLSKEPSGERIDENVNVRNISSKRENPAPTETAPEYSKKGFSTRLHMLKEAGQRMIDTGEGTYVTLVKPQKKAGLSFATVFSSSESVTPSAAELESRVKKRVKHDKARSPSLTHRKQRDVALHIEPAPSGANVIGSIPGSRKLSTSLSTKSQSSGSDFKSMETRGGRNCDFELHIEPPKSEGIFKFSREVEVPPRSSRAPTSAARSSALLNGHAIKSSSEVVPESTSSPILSKSSVSLPTGKEAVKKKSTQPGVNQDSNSLPVVDNARINMNVFRNRSSATSSSIHGRRKNIDKMKAINMIKNRGGLMKSNPNQVKPDLEKKMSLKRRLEEEEQEQEGEPTVNKKSVLSQRFIDLMNARSKHEDLVDVAEAIEQQTYFNKLEKKEQLEEKMLATFKVPCKAVTCLKCKYKWFSASDLCRADGHPIKVIETFKRFFKCDNCKNRTVSLEIIPLMNCKNCGSGKWSRAPMIRDKIVRPENQLCIRGDEQKNLNSLSGSMNLNLLVPE